MAEKTQPSKNLANPGKPESAHSDSAGFKLPNPDVLPTPPAASNTHAAPPATGEASTAPPSGGMDISSVPRDLAIGGGVLAVLFIIFLFVKNTYANRLIARRVNPIAANTSGRWLLVSLTTLSAALILAVVSLDKFLSLIYMGPLAAIAALALFFTLRTGCR